MTLAAACRLPGLLAASILFVLTAPAREIPVNPGGFSLAPPDH